MLSQEPLQLILYSKPGCHLCEGLQEKLEQIHEPALALEIRDITTRQDWFQAYEYEVPVLFAVQPQTLDPSSAQMLPRPSPRATVPQLQRMLQRFLDANQAE
jgi:hypothetical protein